MVKHCLQGGGTILSISMMVSDTCRKGSAMIWNLSLSLCHTRMVDSSRAVTETWQIQAEMEQIEDNIIL